MAALRVIEVFSSSTHARQTARMQHKNAKDETRYGHDKVVKVAVVGLNEPCKVKFGGRGGRLEEEDVELSTAC
jgi:hypothetical protein